MAAYSGVLHSDVSDVSPFVDGNRTIKDVGTADSIIISLTSTETQSWGFITASGAPNNAWWEQGGTWTLEYRNITGNHQIDGRCRCIRLTSGGTILESGTWTSTQSLNADRTFTPINPNWDRTDEDATNRLAIEFEFINTDTMNQSCEFGTNTTDDEVITNVTSGLVWTSINDNVSCFIEGFQPGTPVSGNIDLFVNGFGYFNNNIVLFGNGHNNTSNNVDLFVDGYGYNSANIIHFVDGFDGITNMINLLVSGFSPTNGNIDLFISGTITATSINNDIILMIYGLQNNNNNIDCYIGGYQTINNNMVAYINGFVLDNNNINLQIHGHNMIDDTIDTFISGHSIYSNNIELFISGSGIVPTLINNNIELYLAVPPSLLSDDNIVCIINGYDPIPQVECPSLDPTASIQITSDLIEVYQSRIDALINQLGKHILLEFDPNRTQCPNCIFDPIRQRSTGIYITNPPGPRPFKRGRKCPHCKGRGYEETPNTKCIDALIKWNPKDAKKYGIVLTHRKDIVRIKTYLTEADDLIKAKTAIIDYDQRNTTIARTKMIRSPIPVGLRDSRYCISFWELL
jgi:hypothetical protein